MSRATPFIQNQTSSRQFLPLQTCWTLLVNNDDNHHCKNIIDRKKLQDDMNTPNSLKNLINPNPIETLEQVNKTSNFPVRVTSEVS